ncbi:MAG: hypothetical protein QXW79_01475 [Thermoplasmata archaeon]
MMRNNDIFIFKLEKCSIFLSSKYNMSSYNFTIYKNNILSLDNYGNSFINLRYYRFPTPPDLKLPYNYLDYLHSLVKPSHITLAYYVKATGEVAEHGCLATYTLYANAKLDDGTTINKIGIAQTSYYPNSGGPINTDWVDLGYRGSGLIVELSTNEDCSGTGCGCGFENIYGGWKNVAISLRIDVSVDLLDFCTTPGTQNIYRDMCYDFVSNYIVKYGATQQINDYLEQYCSRKYPNSDLSIFNTKTMDKKDYNICACNMPQNNYDQFEENLMKHFPSLSLGSIRPQCLLPACIVSTFKNSKLNNCPVPQCFNLVDIDRSNIVGNVVINQSQDCSLYGIKGYSPVSPPTSPYEPPSSNFLQKVIQFINEHRIPVIISFLIIILVITAIIVLSMGKAKNE